MNTRRTGALAECIAARFLEMTGYSIVATGYRFHGREIDVIAVREATVAFVEVKFRSGVGRGAPRESVNREKQRRIVHAAKGFLSQSRLPAPRCRFDVIEVELLRGGQALRLEHIAGAFDAD
jgi:putative endonuclease